MARLSDEAIARLKGQRSGMSRGQIIDNKKFPAKMLLRILPTYGDLPGHEYNGIFCKTIGNGTTSPRTFGLECPVMDLFDDMCNSDRKEEAYNIINPQREYWMAVADANDLGTVDHPNIRILKAKQTVYSEILDAMTDEDDGCDITDPKEGCHMRVRKSGGGMDTEWKNRIIQEQKPISDDEALTQAFVDAAEKFSVASRFYLVDLEKLAEIYDILSGGEEIPARYMKKLKKSKFVKTDATKMSRQGADDDDDGGEEAGDDSYDDDETEEEETEEETEETEEEETEEELDELPEGTVVTFEFEDEELTGTISARAVDDEGDLFYTIDVDGDGWDIFPSNTVLTVVEEEVEEEEEEEAEEVPPTKAPKKKTKSPKKPTPKKKAPAKKSPAKKSAPKKKAPAKDKPKAKKKVKKKASAASTIGKKRKKK